MTMVESSGQVTGPIPLPLTAMVGGSMSQAIAVSEACTNACLALQQEMLRFASTRLQTDIETQKSLVSCATLTDATKIQRDRFANAGRDYLEEMSKLMEIAGRAAQDGLFRTLVSVDVKP